MRKFLIICSLLVIGLFVVGCGSGSGTTTTDDTTTTSAEENAASRALAASSTMAISTTLPANE